MAGILTFRVVRKGRFTRAPPILRQSLSQGISGYQPLRRDRRQRLDELQTGDGRAFPQYLKALVNRELDRLELVLKQIKAVEAARDPLLAVGQR
jgi:transposase